MAHSKPIIVTGKNNLRGTIELDVQPSGDNNQVLVRLDNGQKVWIPSEMLILKDDGSYYLPLGLAELEPWLDQARNSETVTIPVVVEELEVQKREVETGRVRITKVVQEHEEVVDEPLLQEEIDVRRVPVNRPVDGPIPIRYSGDTMIVSLLEEVLVVEKRLVLKEELHITKRQVEVHKPQQVTLRREEAIVEPLEPSAQEINEDIHS
jgi:uncharacterized protein (TIGR02271 family)